MPVDLSRWGILYFTTACSVCLPQMLTVTSLPNRKRSLRFHFLSTLLLATLCGDVFAYLAFSFFQWTYLSVLHKTQTFFLRGMRGRTEKAISAVAASFFRALWLHTGHVCTDMAEQKLRVYKRFSGMRDWLFSRWYSGFEVKMGGAGSRDFIRLWCEIRKGNRAGYGISIVTWLHNLTITKVARWQKGGSPRGFGGIREHG